MTAATLLNPITSAQTRTRARLRLCAFFGVAASLLLVSSTNAQTPRRLAAAAAAEEELAAFKEYRGVQLGMTADEVRKKLGSPKDKGDEQDFFVFGESETAQVVYDQTHKVVTISADFLTSGTEVPTAKQVFGSEVEVKTDGSMYKMVRFTKAGYWLSYNRTGGASPLTTVTLQKIQ
jgi:outer membrane protein assembly factor BamE (lipoprotein component of BamABCDE complex)